MHPFIMPLFLDEEGFLKVSEKWKNFVGETKHDYGNKFIVSYAYHNNGYKLSTY